MSCCLSATAQWPSTYTLELAFPCWKPVFFPSTHTANFMFLFPVVVSLFPKLIHLQSTHFSQQFRSKWIVFPFLCLIFIWSIFALLSVIPVCYCLLCIQMHLLSRSEAATLFSPFPSLQFHALSNNSSAIYHAVEEFFTALFSLPNEKNISF